MKKLSTTFISKITTIDQNNYDKEILDILEKLYIDNTIPLRNIKHEIDSSIRFEMTLIMLFRDGLNSIIDSTEYDASKNEEIINRYVGKIINKI